MSKSVDELIADLGEKSSAKRRAAAKKLRKLGDARAALPLMSALKKEVEDTRTWETQYQMVMALGTCGDTDGRCLIKKLADSEIGEPMVRVAMGDALIRLSKAMDKSARPFLGILESGDEDLISGALRAIAMLHFVPSKTVVDRILAYARDATPSRIKQTNRWFWPAAAAAGWLEVSAEVEPFLQDCLKSPSDETRKAATSSLAGKYRKWNPL